MESHIPYYTISTSVKAAYCYIKQLTCYQTFQQLHAGGDYWQRLLFDKTQDTIKHTQTHNTIALNLTLVITLSIYGRYFSILIFNSLQLVLLQHTNL